MKRAFRLSACCIGLLPLAAGAQEPNASGASLPPQMAGESIVVLPSGSTYWTAGPDQGAPYAYPPNATGTMPRDALPSGQGGRYGNYPPPQWDQPAMYGGQGYPSPAGYGYTQPPAYSAPQGYAPGYPPPAYGQGGASAYRMVPPQGGDYAMPYPGAYAQPQFSMPPTNPQGEYPEPLPPRFERGAAQGYGSDQGAGNTPPSAAGRHPCEEILAAYGITLPRQALPADVPVEFQPELPAGESWSKYYGFSPTAPAEPTPPHAAGVATSAPESLPQPPASPNEIRTETPAAPIKPTLEPIAEPATTLPAPPADAAATPATQAQEKPEAPSTPAAPVTPAPEGPTSGT